MRGPFWNNGKTGVTGEAPGFIKNAPNFVTTTDSEGNTVTLVGEEADKYRAGATA